MLSWKDFFAIRRPRVPAPDSCFPKLSQNERLVCFGVFNIIGYLLQMGSIGGIVSSAVTGDSGNFALSYSIGNVLSLIGLLFLVSGKELLKSMNQPGRKFASFALMASMLACLVLPWVWKGRLAGIVILSAVIIQMASYWYFVFTYIPCGKQCCGILFGRCFRRVVLEDIRLPIIS